jgi:hypothetical protein
VRDRRGDAGHAEEVLLRLLDALADRQRHLAGLAVADADHAVAIADHDERGEAEATAALDDLRDAVDGHDALEELALVGVAAATAVTVGVALAAATARLAGLARHIRRGRVGDDLGHGGRGGVGLGHVLLLVVRDVAHRLSPPSRAPSAIAATRPA